MKTATFEVKSRVIAQDGTILAIFDSVQAALTWLDRHGVSGYAVEEKTPNGGWKVRHDI
jgi:hypothetical protein